MFPDRLHLARIGILVILLAFQVSCSTISTNARYTTERQEQASDAVTSGGQVAATAFRATALAAIRQPVTTVKLGIASLWHRPREVVVTSLPLSFVPQDTLPEAPGSWQFEKMLDEADFPRAESGSLKWLVDGPEFFPELDRQIAAARHSIDVQVFIFDNDDIGVRYADVLKRKSGELPVRVLFDDLGTTFAHRSAPETPGPRGFSPPADMRLHLKEDSKVRVRRALNPWLVCDHTKLLIFDQRSAIVGGMNIGREYYSEWHDLMVRVEGPVVRTLAADFKQAWRKAGPLGDFALFKTPPIFRRSQPVSNGIPLRVLRTDASVGRTEILDSALLAIRGARKRIWIQTPYFGHDDVTQAIAAAARRGVDVRLILPARGDSTIMDAGNRVSARTLIQAGARVYQYPGMTHMKVMICDNWASMGSANFDTLSLRINRELNLAFSDPGEIKQLEKKVFLPDFRKSRRLRLADTETLAPGLTGVIVGQL
jgi:cardiolipin synthase A/B